MARVVIRHPFRLKRHHQFSLSPPSHRSLTVKSLTQIIKHNTDTTTSLNNENTSNSNNLYFFSSGAFPYINDRPYTIHHPSTELIEPCKTGRHLSQIQAQLITCGLFAFWAAKILKRASDFGDIDHVLAIFSCIDSPGTVVVNNVIRAYSVSPYAEKAVGFYFEMVKDGFFVNSYTFVSLFGACARTGCVGLGKKCHAQGLKKGVVDSVLPVQNSLIHLYGFCGNVKLARKVFDEMRERDLVSWNSIINGYVSRGDMGGAHLLFDSMPARNVASWNVMISGYLKKANNPGCGLLLFRRMLQRRFKGNETTMATVISACGRSARLKEGRSVHGFVIRNFLNSNVFVCTSLIDVYSKCHKVDVARRVFDGLRNRNLISWNAMILGHCIHGDPADGIDLFVKMVDLDKLRGGAGIRPDGFTYVGVLCACARAGLLMEGRKFFSQMIDTYGVKPNFAHYWCMANLYIREGLICEAEEALRRIADHDVDFTSESSTWANLLISSRFQENVDFGEIIASSLIETEPQNFAHYRLLMNIYAVAGRWNDVERVKEMVRERKIGRIPACNLVDLKDIVHDYTVGHLSLELNV